MKIRRLELSAFGPFQNQHIELDERDPGLYLVYGPNEAGKSTIRRALDGFFFGIPERTNDAFRHHSRNLLIEAVIQDDNGNVYHLKRRKGRKNTLLDKDDQPFDESLLGSFLGHMDRHTFRSMFGLDHDLLRQGGVDLASGKGELGASLFGAASGLTGFIKLKDDLNKKADELFKPRSSNPPINKLIKLYQEKNSSCDQPASDPASGRTENHNSIIYKDNINPSQTKSSN